MDECFHLSYPHIRERLLPIAEQFDKDNYGVYTKSNEVCQSFAAACRILTNDETKPKVKPIDRVELEKTRSFFFLENFRFGLNSFDGLMMHFLACRIISISVQSKNS